MATYNGLDLGPACVMRTTGSPVARKLYAFPGVNGVFSTVQGSRGKTTEAFGVCYGEDPGALADVEQQFRDQQNAGTLADLTDTAGVTWPNVALIEFRPIDEICEAPGFGYARPYRMQFFHFGA